MGKGWVWKIASFVAVVTVASVGISGCSSGDGGSGQGSTDIVQTEGVPTSPSGTLRYTVFQETPSFDPPLVAYSNGAIIFSAYDTLTSSDNTADVKPWLATEWSQPDTMTWQFTLRDDVVFHDGSKFDAETVKLNLERAKTFPSSPWGYVYEPIAAVTVIDPVTVNVSFTTPQPGFPYSMSQIAGAMISPKAIKDGTDLTRAEAGSGGWIWDSNEHVESVKHVFHANPKYWNSDAVKIKDIEILIMPEDSSRLNAVQAGQADVVGSLPPEQYDAAESAGLVVKSSMFASGVLAILDREGTMVPAFANPKVREAMGYLIDREAFNKSVFAGHGSGIDGFAPPEIWWHAPKLVDRQQVNVAKAKKLLAEAGYPKGFTFEAPNIPVLRTKNETIAQMLAAGGITMKIVDTADGQYTADIRKGKFPAAYINPSAVDPYMWWSRSISNNSPFNPFKLTDLADLEEKFIEASALPDESSRQSAFAKLQQEVLDRGLVISTGMTPHGFALGPKVRSTKEVMYLAGDQTPQPYYLWLA